MDYLVDLVGCDLFIVEFYDDREFSQDCGLVHTGVELSG